MTFYNRKLLLLVLLLLACLQIV